MGGLFRECVEERLGLEIIGAAGSRPAGVWASSRVSDLRSSGLGVEDVVVGSGGEVRMIENPGISDDGGLGGAGASGLAEGRGGRLRDRAGEYGSIQGRLACECSTAD